MRLEQRITRLEAVARESRSDGDAELLSLRDVCFLTIEKQRLAEEESIESTILAGLIADMLESHGRAMKSHRPAPMTPEQAHEALLATVDRDEADEEQFRLDWLERLQSKREYIQEVIAELDSLKDEGIKSSANRALNTPEPKPC